MIFFRLDNTYTISGDNDHRSHRAQHHDRIKPQREGARVALTAVLSREEPEFIKRHKIPFKVHGGKRRTTIYSVHELVKPVLVKLVRIYGPKHKPLDKHDGLRSALKPTVDGIADALGKRDDSSKLLSFEYDQREGKDDAVEVQIWERQVDSVALQELPAYWKHTLANGASFVGGKVRLFVDGRVLDVALKVG